MQRPAEAAQRGPVQSMLRSGKGFSSADLDSLAKPLYVSHPSHLLLLDNGAAKKMLAKMQKTNPETCYGIFSADGDTERLCFYAGVPAALEATLSASDWVAALTDVMQGKGTIRVIEVADYPSLGLCMLLCYHCPCSVCPSPLLVPHCLFLFFFSL